MLSFLEGYVRRLDPVVWKTSIILLAAVSGVAVLLTRILGLGPRVMGDELTYSTYSRLLPISDSPVPNYLYLWLFSSTNFCGAEFYSCARLINVGFVVFGAFMLYLIARKLLGFGVSLFLAFASIVGPTSMYAAHFMPDAIFFSASIFFVWLLMTMTESRPSLWTFVLLGLVVGVVSLIKPHGLFLLAPIPAIAVLYSNGTWGRFRAALVAAALSTLGALLVKLGVGFIVAGQTGVALFRSAYGALVPAVQASDQAGPGGEVYFFNLLSEFESLILAAAVLFLVPIAATFLGIRGSQPGDTGPNRRISLTLVVLQIAFLVPVAVFVSQLMSIDSSQALRTQLRYFEFLFLLYPIAALSYLESRYRRTSIPVWIVVTAIAFLSFVWWLEYSDKFLHVYSDATFLPMLARFENWGTPVVLLAFTAALIFGIKKDWAIRVWAFGFLPILVFISVPAMYFDDSIRPDHKPSHLVAAEFTLGTLGADEIKQLIIIGDNRQELDAARFVIGDPSVKRRVVGDPGTFFLESLPENYGWVLVLGQQSLRGYPLQVFEGKGFHLARRDSGNISFFNVEEPGRAIIDFLNIEDLGSLGAWTVADVAAIGLLDSPLAGSRIRIRLEAPRDLLGKEITFRLGSESIAVPVEVVGEPFLVDLGYDNPDFARELFIELPPGSTKTGQYGGLNLTYLELLK